VGNTLTATPGTWDSGVALKYQWFRDGALISGATSPTYVVTMSDVASTLNVKVTGTKEWYLDVTKSSTSTASVLINQSLKPTPTISGTVEVGRTLTAVPGTWDAGVNLADQWLKDAALAVLASGGFHPSGSELGNSQNPQQDI
jgi:archaellum component FlaG (FlaF/FlaG flagellin family)